MLTGRQLSIARKRTSASLKKAGIVLTKSETAAIEVTDCIITITLCAD
jgi:hypothetical protein